MVSKLMRRIAARPSSRRGSRGCFQFSNLRLAVSAQFPTLTINDLRHIALTERRAFDARGGPRAFCGAHGWHEHANPAAREGLRDPFHAHSAAAVAVQEARGSLAESQSVRQCRTHQRRAGCGAAATLPAARLAAARGTANATRVP